MCICIIVCYFFYPSFLLLLFSALVVKYITLVSRNCNLLSYSTTPFHLHPVSDFAMGLCTPDFALY